MVYSPIYDNLHLEKKREKMLKNHTENKKNLKNNTMTKLFNLCEKVNFLISENDKLIMSSIIDVLKNDGDRLEKQEKVNKLLLEMELDIHTGAKNFKNKFENVLNRKIKKKYGEMDEKIIEKFNDHEKLYYIIYNTICVCINKKKTISQIITKVGNAFIYETGLELDKNLKQNNASIIGSFILAVCGDINMIREKKTSIDKLINEDNNEDIDSVEGGRLIFDSEWLNIIKNNQYIKNLNDYPYINSILPDNYKYLKNSDHQLYDSNLDKDDKKLLINKITDIKFKINIDLLDIILELLSSDNQK